MASTVKLKRSAVPGKVPATTDLDLGEIALNTYDGKLYTKKNVSGTETIVEIGAGAASGSSVTTSATAPASPQAGDLWWNSEIGILSVYYVDADSSQWVSTSIGAQGPAGPAGPAGAAGATGPAGTVTADLQSTANLILMGF